MKYLFLILTIFASFAYAGSDVDVYFNAAVEKYLQGDYTNSIINIEKALAIEPENRSTKEFLLKVYIEAATQYSMKRQYSEAMSYLEKAKIVFPDEPRINELYQVTKGVLSTNDPNKYRVYAPEPPDKGAATGKNNKLREISDEREALNMGQSKPVNPAASTDKPHSINRDKSIESLARQGQNNPLVNTGEPSAKELKNTRLHNGSSQIREKPDTRGNRSFNSPPEIRGKILSREAELPKKPKNGPRDRVSFLLYPLLICLAFTITLIIYAIIMKKDFNNLRIQQEKKISEMVNTLSRIQSEKDKLSYEVTLEKERNKLEKEFNEKMDKELEEIRTAQKQETANGKKHLPGIPAARLPNLNKTSYIEKQKKEIITLSTDTNKLKEEVFISQPLIEQTREKIAATAQSIYEESPKLALDFLREMSGNSDSSTRSNIIRALARIARPETLDILLPLNNDPDPRVKREVVKSLRELNKRTADGEITITEEYKNRISELIKKEYENAEWIF